MSIGYTISIPTAPIHDSRAVCAEGLEPAARLGLDNERPAITRIAGRFKSIEFLTYLACVSLRDARWSRLGERRELGCLDLFGGLVSSELYFVLVL